MQKTPKRETLGSYFFVAGENRYARPAQVQRKPTSRETADWSGFGYTLSFGYTRPCGRICTIRATWVVADRLMRFN